MSAPLVYAIILAWNQKQDTVECLESVLKMDYPNFRVIVVDNGSTDGTPDLLRAAYPDVELIISSENVGIARGYNLGIEHALEQAADYVLIMNNDITVDRQMLDELVKMGESRPDVGMLMPKIYHYGSQTQLWCVGARWRTFPPGVKLIGFNEEDGPLYQRLREIEYAPSCCLLLRRETLEKVGLFDPEYFFYNDDWDLSARIRKGGYKILFVPQAKLWHKVSISTQKSDKPAQWWHIMGQSTVRFYLKHSSSLVLAINVVWFVIRETVKGKFGRVGPYLAGIWQGLSVHWGRVR